MRKLEFPQKGIDGDKMLSELRVHRSSDVPWRNGRVFGYIYHAGSKESKAIEQAYHLFFNENALNPSLFSSLRRLENETVAMVADLLHAGEGYAGNLTTGGSESILVAVKTARDWARHHRPEIIAPEIIVPLSVHPAFSKAADMTGLSVRYAALAPDNRVDVKALEEMISPNTILIVGSAPCYPYGVVDPVSELGVIAVKHKLLLHVDACMGGLMLPFIEKLGYPVPTFDFRINGVTSISADMHKYGYSAKGASVVLYKTHEIRKFQYFVYSRWPGGLYASPTMLGTRSGAPIAAAWAALKTIGADGYLKMADAVMKTAKKIQEGIETIPGLKITGQPAMGVFAFTSSKRDIFLVGDELAKRGWHLDKLQFPSALHVTVAYHNTGHEDEFISALRDSVAAVEGQKVKAVSSHVLVSVVRALSRFLPETWFRKLSSRFTGMMNGVQGSGSGSSAAAYGMMASIDNRENVDEIMLEVLDKLYTL